jgi:hypothetical protein
MVIMKREESIIINHEKWKIISAKYEKEA